MALIYATSDPQVPRDPAKALLTYRPLNVHLPRYRGARGLVLGLINPCKAECGLISPMSAPPMRSSWRNTSNPTPSARPRIPDSLAARGRPSSIVSPNSYRLSTPLNTLPPDRDIMEGLHTTPLQTITIPLPGDEDGDIKITDYDFIGSYNWTNNTTPTIIVPGMYNLLSSCDKKSNVVDRFSAPVAK